MSLPKAPRTISNKRRDYLKKESKVKFFDKESFGTQKHFDFINSMSWSKKIRDWHIIKQEVFLKNKKNIEVSESPILYYKDNKIYRLVPKDVYKTWLKLVNKGLSIEKISFANKQEISDIKKILNINKIPSSFKVIKSTPKGLAYKLHEEHLDRPVITLEYLVKSKKINFKEADKISIINQIIKISKQLWENNVIHNHPHPGNWTITYERGYPKVRLIDLGMCSTFNRSTHKQKLINSFIRDTMGILFTVQTISSDKNRPIFVKKASNVLFNVVHKKAEEVFFKDKMLVNIFMNKFVNQFLLKAFEK